MDLNRAVKIREQAVASRLGGVVIRRKSPVWFAHDAINSLPSAGQDVRLEVLSTYLDLFSLSALANHDCLHRLLQFRT